LRTSVFIDGGNVYSSLNNRGFGGQSTNGGYVRFSTGIEADVLTPFGPIELSLATPINRRHGHSNISGDNQDIFQFALGANF
jgi:outer membrane protein insertion porin family